MSLNFLFEGFRLARKFENIVFSQSNEEKINCSLRDNNDDPHIFLGRLEKKTFP